MVWNSRLINANAVEEIQSLKRQVGKNMVLFAGADVAETFINNNLIDEYRLIVNPILLASGKLLFKNINQVYNLKLKDNISFSCG